jgi:hypothetical protein
MMQKFIVLLVAVLAIAYGMQGSENLLCVASHQDRYQDWVANMFEDPAAARNEALQRFGIYKTVVVRSEEARISNDDLLVLGLSRLSWWSPRCKQVLVIVDAYSLVGENGRNPLTKYSDCTGTKKFLTHPRSKLAVVNATCELMAMEFGSDARERELEKDTCLQGSRQDYFEKFRRRFGYVIPKTTPVVDVPPAELLPPGVAMLDLFFIDNDVPVK